MKILYIYDFKGWAIHNVGLLWLSNIGHEITFKSIDLVQEKELDNYDLIWYGYSTLYFKKPVNLKKAIISVHDPCELFAPHKYWKIINIPFTINIYVWSDFLRKYWIRHKTLNLLKKAKNVITTSEEMNNILKKRGINSKIIRTTTDLPIISNKKSKEISLTTIANNHYRKNFKLLKKINKFCSKNNIIFDMKVGLNQYSRTEYVKFIDSHSVYICTSFQEGGPLPAMDAMARGLVILTTPVGQIQEIVKGKGNGFICNNLKEFEEKILFLSKNIKILNKMADKSIKVSKEKSVNKIKDSVKDYLKKIRN